MNLRIAQVIGLNTDQKAAQVVSSVREDGNTFLAVLELVSDDAFTKGRQILSQLEDFYFECEGSTAEQLNVTFKEAEKILSEGESFSAKGGPASGWNICLAAISGKALYLIGKGQVEVYLKREDKLSPLVSAEASSQLVSGFLQEGDRVLLATKSLVNFVGTDLEKSLNLPIEAFEEEVGSKIGVSDLENQGLAALVVEVSQPEPVLEGEGGESAEIAPVSVYDTAQESPKKISISFPAILNGFTFQLGKVLSLLRQLGTRFPKSGRGRLIVAVVLIIIIALGAGYKYKTSRDRERQLQLSQLLQEARDNFDAAKGLVSLNPAEAKTKLDLAQGKVNQALVLQPGSIEAQNFKKQLEQESASVLQQSSVSNFPVFLDMDLVKKNFRADRLSLSGSKLLLMDPGIKTLVAIDLGKKSNQILAGSEQLGEATTFSLNGGLAFVYSKDKGVLKIDTTNSKITVVAKKDSELGDIKDIYGFGGNIYLLDTGQIWKYVATADGYSDKRAYLSKGVQVDFSSALRMQIESSVYVLKAGGEILRLTKGDKDNFSLGGLDKGVKDPKSIFVSSDTDNLYVLDSGNSRLVILTKTGSYKGQIGGDKFATATDLAVDEVGKKVYLLDGSKIYSVDLK